MIEPSYFEKCAFVCVDIQEGARGPALSYEELPGVWKDMGFSADDVNAANAFAWDVAFPNAVKVTGASRRLGLKMIFVHWGYLFEDAMDLDPDIYKMFKRDFGEDARAWSGHISRPDSQPAKALDIQPGEYVIPKTAQDAFASSNIAFVLRNLEVENLVMIGGHTEACLGKTAASAKRLGWRTLCIHDATSNARESTRRKGIDEAGFDYVVSTADYLECQRSGMPVHEWP
ncbi:MAG TPA: isochorismatase family protein, partial [Candidatus Hydrogenedentes bacterium]|nr:isochorismatase family protein [Candidatus Hydrogenedentota bacterium]